MYSFRIRFHISKRTPLNIDAERHDLPAVEGAQNVRLVSVDGETPIVDSRMLAIVSEGYPAEDHARAAGILYRSILVRAFARLRVAADFGDRAPRSMFYGAYLRELEEKAERPVLDDIHGLMVFPSEPQPILIRAEGLGVALRTDAQRFSEVVTHAVESNQTASHQEALAYDLFSASFFETSADARFLLLMIAVETLLDPRPRSGQAQQHVDTLIEMTRAATSLSLNERQSICGSLSWLKKESISQAGRQLAKTLGNRRYNQMKPAAFFTWAYSIRSALVHGQQPLPSRQEVGSAAANVEVFVSDILAGPLRDEV